jgi:hypothetical protein
VNMLILFQARSSPVGCVAVGHAALLLAQWKEVAGPGLSGPWFPVDPIALRGRVFHD